MENYHGYTNEYEDKKVKISIIGVGGGGGNAVNLMKDSNLDGVRYIAINTDAQDLFSKSKAEIKIPIGTHLGAGGNPEYARDLANNMRNEIKRELQGQDMIFITAGMGGGTGTGVSPIVAEISKELGILTVAIVTKPFRFEGPRRRKNAEFGLEELKKHVDTLIVIPNDKLSDFKIETSNVKDIFTAPNEILYRAVRGISDLIIEEGFINVDFADVKSVMEKAGEAVIGLGIANEGEDVLLAVKNAVENPLLDKSIKGAKQVLLNIALNKDYPYKDFEAICLEIVKYSENEDLDVFMGVRLHDQKEVHVTIVATGFDKQLQPLSEKVESSQKIEMISFPKFDE